MSEGLSDPRERLSGSVVNVEEVKGGSVLVADAAAGAVALSVEDAGPPFSESGGQVEIAGTVYAYTAADPELDTITLGAGLGAAAFYEDRVDVYPPLLERLAHVRLRMDPSSVSGAGDDLSDPLIALVEHGLYDRLPSGVREPGTEESVEVELRGGEWVVVNVKGSEPVLDLSYADPATMPPATTTDGRAPANPTDPTLRGGVSFLIAEWDPIPTNDLGDPQSDRVTFEVYVDTAALPATVAGLRATTKKVGETDGTFYFIKTLADGTALAYGTTYHVRLVARDKDGAAALPSGDVTASLVQANTPDIAVGSIVTDRIGALQVTADKMSVSTISAIQAITGLLKTATTGWRVELGDATYPIRYWDGTSAKFTLDNAGNVVMTGSLQSGSGSQRVEILSNATDRVAFWMTGFNLPGYVFVTGGTSTGLQIIPPGNSGVNRPHIDLSNFLLLGGANYNVIGLNPEDTVNGVVECWQATQFVVPSVVALPAIPRRQGAFLLDFRSAYNNLTFWDGAAWQYPVLQGRAGNGSSGSSGTITATAYGDTTGGVGPEASCVAPASGAVLVMLRCYMKSAVAGNISFASWERRIGAAVDAVAADGDSAQTANTQPTSCFSYQLVTGLMPGTTYTFRMKYRVSAGTGTFDQRRIIALPI